ncbi:MAG: MFS transporter [Sulfuricurvum sp.]|uniref:MFS transporter n=1 Tax=Sulfuricurvum sp. TaxID=2025608 RepID=UPI002626A5C8|nr:MFS transporter [Sulfuricurvum sp.]MDD2828040.1 MFS transporter [Sulfuricurvum sp.]MDD4948083.1 MFS transporter [Sulfuricurvum sp.]
MFKTVLPLSAILSLRFFGLFLVLPVLSAYALNLEGATPLLIGVIVGGYALTQAIFQVPFGIMSDKIGRKPTLLLGLVIFLVGSIICAVSNDIYTLMAGRFLQGAGAIGAVIPAMISDLVNEESRGKAMALMGGTIAISFAAAMALGPVLAAGFGFSSLFWIAAVLSIVSMIVLFTNVPTPPRIRHIYHSTTTTKDILKDPNLFSMIITNGMQKGLMTVSFVLIPIFLTNPEYGFLWDKKDLWQAFVPAMVMGLLAMGPAAIFGEKYNKPREIFLISIVLFIVSFTLMGFATKGWEFIVGVVSFFMAFNMMEPLVQSMISKYAKVHQKGAALGIANGFAYFMTFVGGAAAGIALQYSSREVFTIALIVITTLWLLWTLKMQNPHRYSHLYISMDHVDMEKLNSLEHEHIAEWFINETENIVAVKYRKDMIEEEAIKAKIVK